jgi:Asp-tRNA(Asn)/Glu-tRNA(Gln) amidotransferase B subunit
MWCNLTGNYVLALLPIPQRDPKIVEFNRYLARVIIDIIHPALKDDPQREWYFMFHHDLGEFCRRALDNKYPWAYVKNIVNMHVDNNKYWPCITYAELQELYPCEVVSDSNTLGTICDKVLADQPHAVQDYKKGKLAAMNRLKGLVMKETKGKADIQLVESILKEKMK